MMNETCNNPADRGDRAGKVVKRRGAEIKRRIEQLLSRGPMVYRRHREMKETTEIKWDYELEVFVCIKCHSIMHYSFDFAHCPYCGRKVIRTDCRRVSVR